MTGTSPTTDDWIKSLTQTLNAVGDPATIQEITVRVVNYSTVSWWMEAEVTYNDDSKTTVI